LLQIIIYRYSQN